MIAENVNIIGVIDNVTTCFEYDFTSEISSAIPEAELWDEMTKFLCEKSRYMTANMFAHGYKPLIRTKSGDLLMFSTRLQSMNKAVFISSALKPGMMDLELMSEVGFDYSSKSILKIN